MSDGKEETVTLAVLGERVDNLVAQVRELRRDVKGLLWKVALIAGLLGGGGGYMSSHIGG